MGTADPGPIGFQRPVFSFQGLKCRTLKTEHFARIGVDLHFQPIPEIEKFPRLPLRFGFVKSPDGR
jgi:hypothetical protein